MVAIVDYGVGNLFSLQSSFRTIGADVSVTDDRRVLENADRILLPGVGAFRDAAEKLRAKELDALLIRLAENGKPLLGICLGMQLLFDKSYEYGEHSGLSLLPGDIAPLSGSVPGHLKIPHMGWNALSFVGKKHPLFRSVEEGTCMYFVHSYHAVNCSGFVIATAEYGCPVTAAVARGNVMGCQFHPEKSGEAGLRVLKAFCEMKERDLC